MVGKSVLPELTNCNMNSSSNYENLIYQEQAKAFLNAYFNDPKIDPEEIWYYTTKFIEIDGRSDGKELDEFKLHVLIEKTGDAMTIKELRDKCRDEGFALGKTITLLNFFLYKYSKTMKEFLSIPQGENPELVTLQEQLAQIQMSLESAKKCSEEANKKASDASLAESQQRGALLEVKAQEAARDKKKESLSNTSKDESIGHVARNRALNELNQLLHEDPIPLNRAKITLEAATKRAEKSRLVADKAAIEANQLLKETENKMNETQKYLEEVKSKGSNGQGAIWWIERELNEKKKYLPKRIQK